MPDFLHQKRMAEAFDNLTPEQQVILIRAPSHDWFSVCWEGFYGLFNSLQKQGLAHPREPGAQVLSDHGREVQSFVLKHVNRNKSYA